MFTELCIRLKVAMDSLKNDERGVSALEYVILAAVVVAAVIAGGAILKEVITSAFTEIGSAISEQIGSTTP